MLSGRQTRWHSSISRPESGYILITLIFFVAVLAIAAAALAPLISQQIKRDREEELIHRGVQYTRAIKHYVKKFGRYPTKIEDLESTNNVRFLRKRYKDPITGQDFKLLHMGEVQTSFGGGLQGAVPVANLAAAAAANGSPSGGAFGGGGGFGGNNSFGGNSFGGNSGGSFGGNNSGFGGNSTCGGNSGFGGNSSFGGNSGFGGNSSVGGNGPGGSSFGGNAFGGSTFGGNNPGANANANGQTPDNGSDSPPNQQGGFGQPVQALSGFGQQGNATTLSTQVFGGGPIVGVVSTSKEKSIRIFNKKEKYNEWQFIYDPSTDRGGLLSTPNQPQMQNQNAIGPGTQNFPGLQNGQNGFTSGSSPFGGVQGVPQNPGGFQPQQPSPQQPQVPQMPPDQGPQ